MKNYVVLLVVFFSWVGVAHASLEITEVMYDPVGSDVNREWIKLYNNGDKEIKVIGGQTKSAWRISGGETKESLHYINEDLNILAGGYAVIAKNKDIFNQEYPSFLGPVTTSSISFNNTAGIIKIWDGEDVRNIVASREYPVSNLVPIEEEVISYNSIDTIPLIEEDPLVFKITTKIISPKIVVAGIPFSLSSLTTTNTGKTYNFGKFIWNFGDGMQVGVKESKPFDYIYEYPGEYVLTISYFDNSFVEIPDATDRIIIKVIPSDVYISSVGTDSDPYIELENRSKYEVILSGWIIKGGDKTFVFPEGTTLLQGKKIKLSPKITGFTALDIKYITILNPSNEVITTYPKDNKKTVSTSGVNNPTYNNSVSTNGVPKDITSLKDPQIINLNDLGASSSDAKVNISSGVYSIIGLIVIIGLGIASFLFIKKKKDVPDYVERGVSANDMTIIE